MGSPEKWLLSGSSPVYRLLQTPKIRGFLIMGRDPVELAKRAKYKPPAMRVRGVCYTKKSPFRYNEVVQAKQIAKGR